jgi:hypothetical protein
MEGDMQLLAGTLVVGEYGGLWQMLLHLRKNDLKSCFSINGRKYQA